MWRLESDVDNKRVYKNPVTNSTCIQLLCYKDKDGNSWYEFQDLTAIPFTRHFAATKITSLYSLGLTKDDITNHISGLKTVLNSDDPEKYQKAYANILDFENKAASAADPIKQLSSLVPVYFTLNDEPIDSFTNDIQIKKLGLLEADPEAHSFFLQRQMEATGRYMNILDKISQIVLPNLKETSGVLQ